MFVCVSRGISCSQELCTVAICGSVRKGGGGEVSPQLDPRYLTPLRFLVSCCSRSVLVPLFFIAGELWDVDKSPDSRSNREPERKSWSCPVTACNHGVLWLMGYDVTDGEEKLASGLFSCREIWMKTSKLCRNS